MPSTTKARRPTGGARFVRLFRWREAQEVLAFREDVCLWATPSFFKIFSRFCSTFSAFAMWKQNPRIVELTSPLPLLDILCSSWWPAVSLWWRLLSVVADSSPTPLLLLPVSSLILLFFFSSLSYLRLLSLCLHLLYFYSPMIFFFVLLLSHFTSSFSRLFSLTLFII